MSPQIVTVKDLQDFVAGRIVVDVDDMIHRLDPNEAPFVHFIESLPKKETHDMEFKWIDKDYVNTWSDITSIPGGWAASASGTIAVSNLEYFHVGDVCSVPQDSMVNIIVTAKAAVSGAGNLTCQTVNAATITITTTGANTLKILSSSDEEGSPSRPVKSTIGVFLSNYIQIIKTTAELTEVANAVELYGDQDRDEQRLEKLVEQWRKKEQAFLFGTKGIMTTGVVQGAHPQYFTGGVYNLLSLYDSAQIETDANGTLTQAEWNAWLTGALRYGSEKKVVYVAEIFALAMAAWAEPSVRITVNETKFGVKIMEWVHPVRGSVKIVVHQRLLDEAPYNGMAICVDHDKTKYRFLRGGIDNKFYTDTGVSDITQFKDEYRSYCGLQLSSMKKHAVLQGVTAYA